MAEAEVTATIIKRVTFEQADAAVDTLVYDMGWVCHETEDDFGYVARAWCPDQDVPPVLIRTDSLKPHVIVAADRDSAFWSVVAFMRP